MTQEDGSLDPQKHNLELVKDLVSKAYVTQVDYGRWVLASLITVHGGGLFAVMQANDKLPKGLAAACVPIFMVGLIMAILTGAISWINYTIATQLYVRILLAIANKQSFTRSWLAKWGAYITAGAAIATTIASIALLAIAGYVAYCRFANVP